MSFISYGKFSVIIFSNIASALLSLFSSLLSSPLLFFSSLSLELKLNIHQTSHSILSISYLFNFSSFVLHFGYLFLICLLVHQFSLQLCISKLLLNPSIQFFWKENQLYQLFYLSILFKFWRSFRSIFQFSAKIFTLVLILLEHNSFRACVFSSQYVKHMLIFLNWLLFLLGFVCIVLSPMPGYLWFCAGHCVWKVVVELIGELGMMLFSFRKYFHCVCQAPRDTSKGAITWDFLEWFRGLTTNYSLSKGSFTSNSPYIQIQHVWFLF